MPTLAETLSTTTPVSPLLRKAKRLGVSNVAEMMALAASRGCHHYSSNLKASSLPSAANNISDNELTILLIIGENAYEPMAIRCAAQLARSSHVRPTELARLAIMEKSERVLAHIARAGIEHDPEGSGFWSELLALLDSPAPRQEPTLPHWSRFVSMPGIQRSGTAPTCWLTPRS